MSTVCIKKLSAIGLFAVLCIFPCACAARGSSASGVETGQREQTQTDAEQTDATESEQFAQTEQSQRVTWSDLKKTGSMELSYATQFSVDYYEGGYKLFTVTDIGSYLLVPDGMPVPDGLSDITVIAHVPSRVYLAATSGMDFLVQLDCLDRLRFSGTNADGWYIEEAKQAMQEGTLLYAGKYNAPDTELLLAGDCDLAIESTMLLHNPEIKEQLEACGIPVLIEHSSYESHPLGRLEWIRFYGALFGEEDAADAFFEQELEKTEDVLADAPTGKTVAFFYVTANGGVNVRKSGDYISKLIELAGGTPIAFDETGEENARATMTIQMEAFYEKAKDADYLIYNSTIDGELTSVDDLLAKNVLFADFKAVQEGHVYCTGKNMFQETTEFGTMITDIHAILTGQDAESAFICKLDAGDIE